MTAKKRPNTGSKLKDLRPKSVSAAKAGKTKGGVAPRDAASGLATGKRMHKPY